MTIITIHMQAEKEADFVVEGAVLLYCVNEMFIDFRNNELRGDPDRA